MTSQTQHRILKFPEVIARTGRSRSSILRLADTSERTPILIGVRSIG